ncbi:MAG: hypothetical protein V1742_11005 [Pseudomonadota bacterium]
MIININGRLVEAGTVGGENLEEMLLDLQERFIPPDSMVGDVLLNGVLYSEDVPHAAVEILRSEVQRLDLVTRSAEEIALHFIKHAPRVIEALLASLPKIVEIFRLGDEAEANEHFLRFLEPLHLLMNMLDKVGQVMGLRYETSIGDRGSLNDRLDKMADVFSRLLRVQEQSDWVYLADILEYELTPELEALAGFLPHLKETAH